MGTGHGGGEDVSELDRERSRNWTLFNEFENLGVKRVDICPDYQGWNMITTFSLLCDGHFTNGVGVSTLNYLRVNFY